jgi:tRNA dimethylallyltransferase
MKTQKPFVLILFGPTGVGKTDFSLEIARQIPAEIINGDTGQLYTPLTIGTAKPDWKNQSVPHHLFDTVDEPKNITVFEYRQQLIEQVEDIWKRNKLPIIVGGSGFYLKSIFFPPQVCATPGELKVPVADEELWDTVHAIDPQRAENISHNDYYRLRRALAIWQETGKKPSECEPIYDPPFRFHLIYLSRERDDLYERINERTRYMVEHGWIEEVRSLMDTPWESFLYEKKIIGYDVLLNYLHGNLSEMTLDEVIELIQQRTRQYAKRQKTFWKSLERQLNDAAGASSGDIDSGSTQLINLTLSDRALYLTQVLKRLVVLIG